MERFWNCFLTTILFYKTLVSLCSQLPQQRFKTIVQGCEKWDVLITSCFQVLTVS